MTELKLKSYSTVLESWKEWKRNKCLCVNQSPTQRELLFCVCCYLSSTLPFLFCFAKIFLSRNCLHVYLISPLVGEKLCLIPFHWFRFRLNAANTVDWHKSLNSDLGCIFIKFTLIVCWARRFVVTVVIDKYDECDEWFDVGHDFNVVVTRDFISFVYCLIAATLALLFHPRVTFRNRWRLFSVVVFGSGGKHK